VRRAAVGLLLAGCAVTRPVPGVPGQRVVEVFREEPHSQAWIDYRKYDGTKPTRFNMSWSETNQVGLTRVEVHEDGLVVVEHRGQAAETPRETFRRRLPDAVRTLFAALDGEDDPKPYDFEMWCERRGTAPLRDTELCHHVASCKAFGEVIEEQVLRPHASSAPGVTLRHELYERELHEDGAWRCASPRAPGDVLIDEGHIPGVEAESILKTLDGTDAAWNANAAPRLGASCKLP